MKSKVENKRKQCDNEFLSCANASRHTNNGYVNVIEHFRLQAFGKCLLLTIVLNLANAALCNVTINDEQTSPSLKYANDSLVGLASTGVSLENASPLVWSEFLEDYVLSQSSARTSKDLPFIPSQNDMSMMGPHMSGGVQGPLSYHSSAYKRPNIYVTKRIGEAVELEPHIRPPVHVMNQQFRPMTNQMIQQQQLQEQQKLQQRQQPGFFAQLFGLGGGSSSSTNQPTPPPPQPPQAMRPVPVQQHHQPQPPLQQNGPQPPFRAVTENDLYLLGAIEKLVYRVDYLENRIRRAEQLIYYLMAGNNQKEVHDPCPTNFTRISDNCYYINSQQQVNWKTANSACKALNAHLAEFERVSENEEIMAHLLNQPQHRGRDYWLGGLNPGLLWIWSNSAKPVNPNTNLTSIAMSHANNTESNTIDDVDGNVKDEKKTDEDDISTNETILNNTVDIEGQGRCLRLSYNPKKHIYNYYGQECTSRHYYICETEDKTLDNNIQKITRELKLPD